MAERSRMRFILIGLGALGGMAVPFVAHRVQSAAIDGRSLGVTALAVVVNGAFGALAGWALGALVEYLFGDKS